MRTSRPPWRSSSSTPRSAGRGSLVVVPDGRDAARTAAALSARVGPDAVEVLTADLGPSARYRAFLRVLRGDARVVVGTRAAAFAPVGQLGLVVVWDDGDDLLAEPHAPYWHAREVAAIRAEAEGAALVLGAHARSVEAAAAVASGWAREVVAPRPSVRDRAPRVRSAADDDALARDPAGARARLPHVAWAAAREGLARGPVLVQVPRRGYVPALACRRCREPARCRACGGPLGSTAGGAAPACAWCGRPGRGLALPGLRRAGAPRGRVGSARTAEELGRAFPGVPVVTSGGESVVAQVPDRPALVVATPGAEPVAPDGYAAALLLDGDLLLGRADLRASEEAARRWFNAVALVRPRGRGGAVVLVADPGAAAVQAVLRADPGGLAARELADRVAAGLPPAVRAADVSGAAADVDDLMAVLEPPPGLRVLGPTPVTATRSRPTPEGPVRVRALLTVPLAAGDLLCAALKAAAAVRSARKEGGAVVVRVDPVSLD